MPSSSDVAHAPYGSPFANLIFARRKDTGEIVHVRDVPSGLDLTLLCPAANCGAPLVARKGSAGRVEHFAHHAGAAPCAWRETAAHLIAKAVLAESLWLDLPAVTVEFGGASRTLRAAQKLTFDEVDVEHRLDGLTPDVILRKVDPTGAVRELLVEVRVTHGCGPEKIARVRSSRYACVEIDLRRWKTASELEIGQAVLRIAPRSWLHNDLIAAELTRRKEEEATEREAKVRAILSRPRTRASTEEGLGAIEHLRALGQARLCAIEVGPDGVFACPEAEWQAILALRYLIEGHEFEFEPGFSLPTVAKWLRAGPLLHPQFRILFDAATLGVARRLEPGFLPPSALVRRYFNAVLETGALERLDKDRWERRGDFATAVKEARRREEVRTSRLERARSCVDGLIRHMDPEIAQRFSRARWERRRIPPFGLTLDALAGSDRWNEVTKALDELEQTLGWFGRTTPCTTLGLPLDGAVARAVAARIAGDAAKVEEKRRRAAAASQEKVARIERYAATLMGAMEGEAWMEPQRVALLDDDDRQAAAWRDLEAIGRRLEAEAQLAKIRDDCRARLLQAALARLDDQAEAFLHCGNNNLGGERPWDHCRDERSFRACLMVVDRAPLPRRRHG